MSNLSNAFVFFLALFVSVPVKGTDSVEVTKAFTRIWEELEEYRSLTASNLESLDVHDSSGKVDSQLVKNIMDEAEIKINNVADEHSKKTFYYDSVKGALTDYYLSEYLVNNMEILYQTVLSGEPSLELYSQISGEILSLINSTSISIVDGINYTNKTSPPGLGDVDFLTLFSEAKIFGSTDIHTYSDFYFSDSLASNPALSIITGGEDNFFIGRLFFRLLTSLEKIFPDKALYPEVQIIGSIDDEITSKFFLGFENARRNQLNKRAQTAFSNFLHMGKFEFSKYETDILKLISTRLKDVFGDLAEKSPLIASEVNKTKKMSITNKNSKKQKGKAFKKGNKKKNKNSKMRKQVKKKKVQEDIPLGDIEENYSPIVEELLPQDVTLDDETKTEAVEDKESVTEFNFMEWYAQEVSSRLVQTHEKNESQQIEPHMNMEVFPQFNFNANTGADAFYKAVMCGAERPVVVSDFEDFLRAVSGGYDKESKSGSAVGYWLPNLSESRQRNPYLKFMIHLPHGGSIPFPQKTLKFFLKRAFNTCNISRGIIGS